MNFSANRSLNTNKSQVSQQVPLSEDAIDQSDVEQTISRPNNSPISEGPVNSTNESLDNEMAKELDRANDSVATGETKPLNSPESNDLQNTQNSEIDAPAQDSTIVRQHPIAPPSEPKQYRAIGLVRGRYQASTEQFTRGILQTPDGTEIDAVLLGRVMSLLKNHLDLETEHLWVVYPRTRQQDDDLHLQIMGVWEPETLRQSDVSEDTSTESTDESTEEIVETPQSEESDSDTLDSIAEDEQSEENESKEVTVTQENLDCSEVPHEENSEDNLSGLNDGYFSIRGEVIYQSQDEEYVIVKVRQSPRKNEETPKFFKLKLKGNLGDRPLNRFWDLHIRRQETSLVIQYGNDIGALLFNRRKPAPRGKGKFSNRRGKSFGNSRPQNFNSPTKTTAPRKEAVPKPIKKKKTQE
jgi:hypothetical protein